MEESAFHAAKIAEEDGGQERGGKDKIWPLGKLERAMDMPAIWYLPCQWSDTAGVGGRNPQWK
jgi:hypothetical protein